MPESLNDVSETPDLKNASARRRVALLPNALINRIAAGEVVERPASVVKELVENALDAGASRIDIMASAAGRNIRVADNGCGMTADDAALAFYNHATSKISSADDLDAIGTLGFRGEALASIGSISKLACTTRTAEAATGLRVMLDEAGEPTLSEAGCAVGTIMEVSELFYNTPARLKFMKKPATELSHIEECVQSLALSHPHVQITLTLNERLVLKTSGAGDVRQCIEDVFGLKNNAVRLLPVRREDDAAGFSLSGFTSEPGDMRSSKRWMLTYVNQRAVRCPTLQKAILAAYEALLPGDRYPFTVLFLTLPTTDVDVNVHPTKREVRYSAPNQVFSFVRVGLRESMIAAGLSLEAPPPPSMTPPPFASFRENFETRGFASEGFSGSDISGAGSSETGLAFPQPVTFPGRFQQNQAALDFYQPDLLPQNAFLGEQARLEMDGITPSETLEQRAQDETQSWGWLSAAVHEVSERPVSPLTPPRFKVIGQLFHTYILLETVQGLMVVDQHIASERAFFEALSTQVDATEASVQHLLTPKTLFLSPVQRTLLFDNSDAFARLGFQLKLQETSVEVHSFPLLYAGRDGMFERGGLFENLLAQLEETGRMQLDIENLVATLACHSAVRAGDPLTHAEMQEVIRRWLACQLPWTCPHGRPIAHTIPAEALNHFFHRPSLPVNAFLG